MANVNNDICDIVKKCKILLLDIEGTTTSISFVKDKLFPYAEENVKEFLEKQWESQEVKDVVAALRKLAIEDQEKNVDGVVTIPGEDTGKDEQIEGLVKNVKWQMSSDRKVGPLKQLQGLIWKLGYDKGDIKGHVYDDVSPALEQWKNTDGQKVYIYSSGSVQAQKLLFGQSVAGDLLPLIEGHFDTAIGAKQDAASYTAIAEKIGCKPEEILFLTDIIAEAEAARSSGIQVALVSREGNGPLTPEASSSFPVLHSFTQLTVTNKRKPEQQVEDTPAKVPKTDVENNVKTTNEPDTDKSDAVEAKDSTPASTDTPVTAATPDVPKEKTEKMDVEEEPPKPASEKTPEPIQVETVIEEVTDTNEVEDAAMIDAKPLIEENVEKTDKSETEKMDAEPIENVETVDSKPKEPAEQTQKVTESAPAVITEIKEVTQEDALNEVEEIIEDLVPVVEEPPVSEDMEELQNVGEVLEKECDEILSKVQDVTNLANMPIKPMLNTITEETMETENIDSNDIVDRILDTEIELGMKPCDDIDVNTVQEITDKPEAVDKSIENPTIEEKTTEKVAEENKVTNDKAEKETPEVRKDEIKEKSELITNGNTDNTPATEDKNEMTTNTIEETKVSEEKVKDDSVKESKENDTNEKATESSKVEDNKVDEKPPSEEAKESKETNDTEKAKDTTEVKEIPEEATVEKDSEKQVNGKANGSDIQNGDASKDEELNARLTENGKELNGANGDSNDNEQVKENKVETNIPDIKVKSVAIDEPRTDPIEQPTEA